MPSVSGAQHRGMCAKCHGTGYLDVSKKVACEFCSADKGKHFPKKRTRKLKRRR